MVKVSFDDLYIGEEFLYFGEEYVKVGLEIAKRLQDGQVEYINPYKMVVRIV